MGIEALTHRDDGSEVPFPSPETTGTYGSAQAAPATGYSRIPSSIGSNAMAKAGATCPGRSFLTTTRTWTSSSSSSKRAESFEAGILRLLEKQYDVTTVASGYEDIRSLDKARDTFEAMRQGAPIIYQPVLWGCPGPDLRLPRLHPQKRRPSPPLSHQPLRRGCTDNRPRLGRQPLALSGCRCEVHYPVS